MSRLNRKKLQKLILSEFKMMGMAPLGAITPMSSLTGDDMHVGSHEHGCDACGMSPCGCDEYEDDMHDKMPMMKSMSTPMNSAGSVSREDCCEAVKCLIECCSCPITKAALLECCEDILSGDYDNQ
tara:strand:- start:87 stop:464 length:378 start_codon:yes stop_codon:yes gene_type:complete